VNPGLEVEEWLHTYGHDSGTALDLAQQVRDLEGAAWRNRIQGCACCGDVEREKGSAEEERLRDCLLLGLVRWRKGRQGERTL
jgi:hypothetical protein